MAPRPSSASLAAATLSPARSFGRPRRASPTLPAAGQLTLQTVAATGGTVDAATADRIRAALLADSPIAVTDATAAKRQATLATFYGAAMSIMFVFFATQYGTHRPPGRASNRHVEPPPRGADRAWVGDPRRVDRRVAPRAVGDDRAGGRDHAAGPRQLGPAAAGRCPDRRRGDRRRRDLDGRRDAGEDGRAGQAA